jgi:hypothetical protein
MSSDWNVDDAVNEIMAWVHDGSALPFLSPPDDLKLKSAYRNCLQKTKDRKINWNLARKRVLPMAYMVGTVATLLAAVDQASKGTHSKPERVLPQHAWQAAYLMSRVCTFGAKSIDGIICAGMPLRRSGGTAAQNDLIATHLREIFKILELV